MTTIFKVWIGFLGGIVFGVLVMRVAHDISEQAVTAIEKCESALPRNQHCVIVAVPEKQPL